MKIAIMGAGALGCYFGGRLVEAGYDVAFIARGEHLRALQNDGLTIESPLGNAELKSVTATSTPAEIGTVDLVIFLAKLYDTEAAAQSMLPLLGADTPVVSFQNGIDGWERIGNVAGHDRVIGGSAYIFADIRAPGIVRHSNDFARLVLGEFDGRQRARTEAIAGILANAGIEHQLVDNIAVRVWEKFILLCGVSGLTTLTRLPIGAVLADAACASLLQDAFEEAAAVGLEQCPALAPDIAERQMTFARSLPYGLRASMLDDLERGKRLELNHLSGEIVRRGAELNIATPVHSAITRALSPYSDGGVRG